MTAVDFEAFVGELATVSGEAIRPFFRTALGVQKLDVEDKSGGTTLVPGDLVGAEPEVSDFEDYIEGSPESFEKETGWFARLSAPGYLDATDWDGPFATEVQARRHVEDH